jgi:flagellar hook-associated protein 2
MAGKLTALHQQGTSGSLVVSSSSTKVKASLTGTAQAGTYIISDVSSLARPAVATSNGGYATAGTTEVAGGTPGETHKLYLMIDGEAKEISLADGKDNLLGVRDAINALGAGVNASVLDTGQSTGRYFLSIASVTTGEKSIELRRDAADPASDLLTTVDGGANAVFQVNGQTVERSQNRFSDVIDGITIELADTTGAGETIAIQTTSSRTPLAGALNDLATSYNTLLKAMEAHTGRAGGALAGDQVIRDVSSLMRGVAGARGSGGIASLAELGVAFNQDGTMSVDTTRVSTLPDAQLNAAFAFLGGTEAGLGDLSERFRAISDPLTGSIRTEIASIDQSDQRIQSQIALMTERVNFMQTTMMARLQAADALLSRLESQQSLLTSTIESLNTVTYGKKSSS